MSLSSKENAFLIAPKKRAGGVAGLSRDFLGRELRSIDSVFPQGKTPADALTVVSKAGVGFLPLSHPYPTWPTFLSVL